MKSFVAGLMVLALVGSAHAQGALGGLLGGLGLTGQQQPQRGPLGNLLGGLGLTGQQQQQQLQPQQCPIRNLLQSLLQSNQMNGPNGQDGMRMGMDLTQNTLDQLTQLLNQQLGPQGMRSLEESLRNQGAQGPYGPRGMNQNNVGQTLMELPRRTIEMLQQALSGISRALPGGDNQQQQQMMMPRNPFQQLNQQQPGQNLLNNLPAPLNQLPGVDNMARSLTQPMSEGRMPDVNQVTGQLNRSLSGLAQNFGNRLPQQQQQPQQPQSQLQQQ